MAVFEAIVKRKGWFFELGTAVMCLVAGDGALWLSGVGEEGDDVGRGRVVRVLATFVFLGLVEPVWRNVSLPSPWPPLIMLLLHISLLYIITDGRK